MRDSEIYGSVKPLRLIVVAITAPPLIAVFLSLWPVERNSLLLGCIMLLSITLVTLPFIRTLRILLAAVTSIAVLLSVMTDNWPLRMAHALSRPSFDRVAAEVRAGNPPPTPCRVGLFRIEKAHVNHHGVVCLWTSADPGGPTGFVQHGPTELPFNLWSHQSLGDSWQFIQED